MVLAIMAKQHQWTTEFTFVESDKRKAAFLQVAAIDLDLPVKVLKTRAEKTPTQRANIVTARALAPLDTLLKYASLHMTEDGVAIFPKGKTAEDEIVDAKRKWTFDLKTHPSITDPNGTILLVERIARV